MNASPAEEHPTPTPPVPSSSAESGDGPSRDLDPCANCDTPLTGTYCAVCGQRAANRVVPLWQVTNEFLEDLFDLDLRILRTLPTFFFRPGHLTVEYVHGRRRRYIRPLRLYLFSSFLLFTVLALTNLNGFSFSFAPFPEDAKADVEAARMELEALRADLALQLPAKEPPVPGSSGDSTRPSSHTTGTAPENREELRRLDEALAGVESILGPRSDEHVHAPISGGPSEETPKEVQAQAPPLPKLDRLFRDPGTFVNGLLDRAPYLMFLLVPTFALLLKLLYLRRKRLYLEHLIFALHVHALAFIAFALSAVLSSLNAGTALNLDWWLAASPFGYLFLALRHVYGQSTLATAGKTVALLIAYGIILAVAVVGLVLTTLPFA